MIMKHGGNISQAARHFGFQPTEMIDLSTGISPRAYPVDLNRFTADDLIQLPQDDDAGRLMRIMDDAWSVPDSVKIALAPGSGLIISLLPGLCRDVYAEGRKVVLCPSPVYGEHRDAWQDAGFDVRNYPAGSVPMIDDDCAAVIAVQPGNPMGGLRPVDDWLPLLNDAATRQVMVVMDEAFIDLRPDKSLIPQMGQQGQVVIRSLGKFYGLAGLRLGAAAGHPDDMARFSRMMGPWPVSSLALQIGAMAIGDHDWADRQRQWLSEHMQAMMSGLTARGMPIIGGTDLYCLINAGDAAALQDHLGKAGFWTRIFEDNPTWMRLGIPLDDVIMTRFFTALDQFDRH